MEKNITLGNNSGHYAKVGLLRGRLESLEDFKPFAEGILAYAEDSELGLFLKPSSKLLNGFGAIANTDLPISSTAQSCLADVG